jgi:hypothetical protein
MSNFAPEKPEIPQKTVDDSFATIILTEFGIDVSEVAAGEPEPTIDGKTVFGTEYMNPQHSFESPAASWNGTKTNQDEAE